MPKRLEPMMGTIQWTLARDDHPNQKRQIGMRKGANDCDGHTLLRFELPLVVVLGFLNVVQVGEEGRHDDQRSNENAEERQAEELLPPVVDTNENDREGLKSDVEKGID